MMEQMGGAGGMPDLSQFGGDNDDLDEVDDEADASAGKSDAPAAGKADASASKADAAVSNATRPERCC